MKECRLHVNISIQETLTVRGQKSSWWQGRRLGHPWPNKSLTRFAGHTKRTKVTLNGVKDLDSPVVENILSRVRWIMN
jgi:hypothetical protein